MTNANTDRLDAMMRKVQGLLAKADDSAATPEEADSARQAAERIMTKYKIEQEDLIARGEAGVNGFDILFKETLGGPIRSPYDLVYAALLSYAVSHTGCQGVWTGYRDGERVLTVVGYEADIRYAEALFTSARLHFAARMEPKPDPNLSDADNVYAMRSAGMERINIARALGWGTTGSATAKVTRLYKQACEARGEAATLTGRGVDVKAYREAYAKGFKDEFWWRLYKARQAIEAEIDGGLVLHGRDERILEAMYNRWPHMRPSATPAKRGGAPARLRKPTKADERRAERENSPAARAGRSAGARAAAEVDIIGQTPKRRLA